MEVKVGIASDHGGFTLKESIKNHFGNIIWDDCGTHSLDSVDYPDYAQKLCQKILNREVDFGIAICGTGIGISIACNRFRGIRAALCHNPYTAEMARRHNNANILALGGRVIRVEDALPLVEIFLKTPFDGGRHEQRIKKIDELGI